MAHGVGPPVEGMVMSCSTAGNGPAAVFTGVPGFEWVGYLASLLVFATFCMQGMLALRAVAIASNVAFIAYAALAGIGPVLLLHVLLLPMNVHRLWQCRRVLRDQRLLARAAAAALPSADEPGRAGQTLSVPP